MPITLATAGSSRDAIAVEVDHDVGGGEGGGGQGEEGGELLAQPY